MSADVVRVFVSARPGNGHGWSVCLDNSHERTTAASGRRRHDIDDEVCYNVSRWHSRPFYAIGDAEPAICFGPAIADD